MISSEGYIDGSWKLKVVSEDLNGVVLFTVFDHTICGEIMKKVSQHFNLEQSQTKLFSLWCPSKRTWLLRSELTLHQLSLNANTTIMYMKKIRQLNVHLNTKGNRKFYVDFSLPILNILQIICLDLRIKEFYLFSFTRCYKDNEENNILKQTSILNKLAKSPITSSLRNLAISNSTKQRLSKNLGSNCPWTPTSGYGSLTSALNSMENIHGSSLSIYSRTNFNYHINEIVNEKYQSLRKINHIKEFRTNFDRSKIKKEWTFLSKSLMEQGITEHNALQLKIKSYLVDFDLEKLSEDVIDFYFNQMKNIILSGEIEIELNLALVLGALQYRTYIVENGMDNRDGNSKLVSNTNEVLSLEDEINIMLESLERELLANPYDLDNGKRFYFRVDYFVFVQQIFPIKSSQKLRMMKLKLIKDHIAIFKENIFSNSKYEFYIKSCRFQAFFGVNSTENRIVWTFENNKKLMKIETKFFTDEDFLFIYSCAVSNSNYWSPSLRQCFDCEKSAECLLQIFRSLEEPEFNIFNMPRMELIELLGSRIGKRESSGKHLKTILKYYCNYKTLTSHEAKIQYLRICMNIPRYNYHYFFVQILEPLDKKCSTVIAINEEMFMILDSSSHSIVQFVLPWTSLKTWNINVELNKLDLYFTKQFISFTICFCSAICFHEYISTFIWRASDNKTLDKSEKLNDLLNLINVKT